MRAVVMVRIGMSLAIAFLLASIPLDAAAEDPPAVEWIVQSYISYEDDGVGIGVDASGNIFVANIWNLLKFTPSGVLEWGDVRARSQAGIVINAAGVYTAGGFYSQTNWWDVACRIHSPSDGAYLTDEHRWGGIEQDLASDIVLDSTGAVYIVGLRQEPSGDNDRLMVWKRSADLEEIWTKEFFGDGIVRFNPTEAAVDPSDNLYVVGTVYAGSLDGQSFGSDDAFISKIDSSGEVVWLRQFGTSGSERANDVATDGTNVYVTGEIYGAAFTDHPYDISHRNDAFVVAFDTDGEFNTSFGIDGAVQFTTAPGENFVGRDRAFAIAVDASSVFVSGHTYGSFDSFANADPTGMTRDAFLRKLDFSGNEVWTIQYGTIAEDDGGPIALTDSAIYVTGTTYGSFDSEYEVGGVRDTYLIRIPANQSPVADAGPDLTVTDVDMTGFEAVTLDGSASSDPDGDDLDFEWLDGFGLLGDTELLSVELAVGDHVINLTVTDSTGASTTDDLMVTVVSGDLDNDGLPDVWEMEHFGTTDYGPDDDPDGDGLTICQEWELGTDPSELDSDGDGFTDGEEAAWGTDPNDPVAIPEQLAFYELIELVVSFNLHNGIANSLDAKLQNALRALEDINADRRSDAINKLEAFAHECEAQRGNWLTDAQADVLIAGASAIVASINR